RERDIRNTFALPDGLSMANFTDPLYAELQRQAGASGLASYMAGLFDPALGWRDLDWLCSLTRLPVVVKGVMTGEDARLAFEHGASAVVVSNHGGRQLDTAPGAIEMLTEVVQAVDGRGEVYVDGGIRRGTDV